MNWKVFFAKRFTSFRFSWGFFSLFLSIFTFSIVLTDRFPLISLPFAIGGCLVLFFVVSILLDVSGVRQSINRSESQSNPQMMELCNDVKEIKLKLK